MMRLPYFFWFLLSLLVLPAVCEGRSYPVKEIEGNFCGQSGWICKIELPRILKADYLSYEKLPRYRQIYTVMRGGTYFWGRDFGFGSHQGIDIAGSIWTAVFSAGDGKVILAEAKGEWGKVMVIKHEWNGEVLHTVYAHLEDFEVKVGDIVKEGQLIAKMGNTGNSTGPHLHFQIDTNETDHPFFPKWCGGTITEVVNEARCWNQVKNNTLDPILFLETQGSVYLAERQGEKNITSSTTSFLDPYEIDFSLDSSVLLLGKSAQLIIKPKNIQEDAFLQEEVTIDNDEHIEIYPKKISYLGSWRTISLIPKTAGLHTIILKSGNNKLKRIMLFVLDKNMRKKLEEKAIWNSALEEILSML